MATTSSDPGGCAAGRQPGSAGDPARSLSGARSEAIDVLRGLVMVLMVVDHARDYLTVLPAPEDLTQASPALFLTRWITHFCAPVFVALAGASAWIYGSRGRSKRELSRFLLTRGLWLVLLELTVINYAWLHGGPLVLWGVIAAIGVGMVALAGLVYLPRAAVVAVGLALVAGQDVYGPLGDGLTGRQLDAWRFLHTGFWRPSFGLVSVGPWFVLAIYPVLAWIGVIALGYAAGPWLSSPRGDTDDGGAKLWRAGAVLLVTFVVVRVVDGFGSPDHWVLHDSALTTGLSFLNCRKYPPSLAYLTMTLGPACLLLAALRSRVPRGLAPLAVFGRVPLFFYVLHLVLLHVGARAYFGLTDDDGSSTLDGGEWVSIMRAQFSWLVPPGADGSPYEALPADFTGLPLPAVYVATALTAVALYVPCVLYGRFKKGKGGLWSYL